MPGLTRSWTDFDLYESCNLLGTQRLLEAARGLSSLRRLPLRLDFLGLWPLRLRR